MSKGRDDQPHIGIFGRRNCGKSSLINYLAGYDIADTTEIPGTTVEPVKHYVDLHGAGPVILIDTSGIDDVGEVGRKRLEKTFDTLQTIDLAILVINNNIFANPEKNVTDLFQKYSLPFLIIHLKSDIDRMWDNFRRSLVNAYETDVIDLSTKWIVDRNMLTGLIRKHIPPSAWRQKSITGDLLSKGDMVMLITNDHYGAPDGKMYIHQTRIIRDVLDNEAVAVIVRESEIDPYIRVMSPKPRLIIAGNRAFRRAAEVVPSGTHLTTYSVIQARHKGDFANYLRGTPHLSSLKDGDKILLHESCSDYINCDDPGKARLSGLISQFTGKKLQYEVAAVSGRLESNPESISLVVMCEGCTLTRNQIIKRLKPYTDRNIPVTCLGMAIAYMQGIYEQALAPFSKLPL